MHDPKLPEAISIWRCIICTVCEQPAIDGRSIAAVTNKKVPWMLKFELSPLQLPMLHSASSTVSFTYYCKCTRMFNFREIFTRAFKIYIIWPQANKYATNTLLQCSPASVGLTQARPTNINFADLAQPRMCSIVTRCFSLWEGGVWGQDYCDISWVHLWLTKFSSKSSFQL